MEFGISLEPTVLFRAGAAITKDDNDVLLRCCHFLSLTSTVTMPRPPSKHGLERKYKSWRKGKSKSATSKGSLKHQLRGKERLLAKLPETETERRKEMQEQIQALKTEIETKQILEKERQNAKDSHGLRFLERQRLTRNERSTRKLLASASTEEEKTRYETELRRIALDQVYVAHFPHDMRYVPLFRNGVRMIDVNARKLARRATTRKRILKNLTDEERVKWIPADQYERLPKEWSVEMEKDTFAAPVKGDTAKAEIHDNRFAASLLQHAVLVEAAEKAESQARKEEEKKRGNKDEDSDSSDDSSDSESSSDDEANPLKASQNGEAEKDEESSDSDSSDNDSSSDSEVETMLPQTNRSLSDDDSSSDSDSSDQNDPGVAKARSKETPVAEEFDDFLMPASDEINVFEKSKEEAPQYDFVSGDKSKGWATQRQRPGQFKKRRVR